MNFEPSNSGNHVVVPFTHCTKEAARLLGVSHRTLEDWRQTGFGPPFQKWGRQVRYLYSDILQFLDRPRYRNTGEARAA